MRVWISALLVLAETLTIAATSEAGENWPAWRGPHRDGVSAERNLPLRWDTEENISWKLALPEWSGSTPIIWGDKIFLNVADGRDIQLWCVDRNTGVPIWKKRLSDGNHRERKQNMSTPSPVTDGQHVYIMTGTGIFAAFDFEGNQLWRRDIQRDYGRFGLNWGYASSPLLFEDALFAQVLHGMRTDDPSYVLRIDKYTGRTVWAGRAADGCESRVSRFLHDSGLVAARRSDRDRHHRRRRRHGPRPGHGRGALASGRPSTPGTTATTASSRRLSWRTV